MLTRPQVLAHLLSLGFTEEVGQQALAYAGIYVRLLDAPRIAACSPQGCTYLVVSSARQLEEQLTSFSGYQHPPG